MRTTALSIPYPDRPDFVTGELFTESFLKLYWARLHAHHVSCQWEHSVKEHFHAACGGQANLYYRVEDSLLAPPVHPSIPLQIGDCIRNLRSALDYLVSILARRAGLPDNNTIFPFNKTKAGIEASFNKPIPGDKNRKRRRSGALYDLSRKYPDLRDVILDTIQPYSASDGAHASGDLLWRVITADNIDKHRLMMPCVNHTEIGTVRVIEGPQMKNLTAFGPGMSFGTGSRLDKNSKLAVDIVFSEPATLAGKPVTSALVQGANQVASVIEIFRRKYS